MIVKTIIENNIEYLVNYYNNGGFSYHYNGVLHREGELPAVVIPYVYQLWIYHGKYHRVDGPAVMLDGKTSEWYYHGIEAEGVTSQEQFEQWIKLRAFE